MRTLRKTSFLVALVPLLLASRDASAVQYFTEVPGALGTQPCGTGNAQGCYTNYLLVADLDNDGKLDIVIPNSGSGDQPFLIYKGNGDATFTDVSASAVNNLAGKFRVVAAADVTGDGFLDLYVPSANGGTDRFLINDGTGNFKDEAAERLPGVNSHSGAVRFGDVDGDGDMDLLVGDSVGGGTPLAHLYINDGTGHFTESLTPLPTTSQGNQPYDFDLLDMDGDFDLDLFIDMHSGKGSLWENDGKGGFTDVPANLPNQSGLKYGPGTCDVDGDGDVDIWQDNSGPNYTEQLMINDGTGKFTDETSQRVTGNPGADDNGVTCIDADGDGDFDAAVTALGGPERLLINDGTGHFVLEQNAFPNPGDSSLWVDFGDLNGDGKLDVVTGQGESGAFLNKVYIGSGAAVVDTTPPRFRAVEQVGSVTPDDAPVVRFGVADNAATDTGPRLKSASIKITAPTPMEIQASFIGADLFRAVLPKQSGGTEVKYQACATDRQGNAACSTELSYKVTGMGPATTGSGGGGTGGNNTGGNNTGGAQGGEAGSGVGGGGTAGSGGGNPFDLDEGGCGCSVPGAPARTGVFYLALAGLLAGLSRRRRNRR
ncbi:MAG: VCBS repeat-containing protein [Polyangiaceae bacterium]